ncbi:MAG: Gmad2 immunoglobulin-like domain-containing protein [Actinomycetota bacterium]
MARLFRLLALAIAALLLAGATACSDDDGDDPGGASPPAATSSPPTAAPASPSPTATVTYEVWYQLDKRLFLSTRTEPATARVGTAAIEALLAGPSDIEAGANVTSSVPAGTALNGLTIEDGIAVVDLTAEFASSGSRLRVAQVVYTLTQFPTVEGVVIAIDGESAAGEPQSRRDFKDLLPAILVTAPSMGATVSSPVTIAGTANVFEATVSLRILDADGNEIARDFTTATCGTGCRGDYSTTLKFDIGSEQPGTIEVFEESAEDGSDINVVSIPVVLAP